MGHTTVDLEGGDIAPPIPGYHGKPDPVRLDKPELPGAYPIRRKCFNTPVLIQGILRLLEVQKYPVAERLPHVGKILKYLGF